MGIYISIFHFEYKYLSLRILKVANLKKFKLNLDIREVYRGNER